MRKLLLCVITVLCLACEPIPENILVTELDTFSDTQPVSDDLLNIAEANSDFDQETLRLMSCHQEVIIIKYNCWIILCSYPCRVGDGNCFEFYCEGDDGESDPY
jgi:hypothetical protein